MWELDEAMKSETADEYPLALSQLRWRFNDLLSREVNQDSMAALTRAGASISSSLSNALSGSTLNLASSSGWR